MKRRNAAVWAGVLAGVALLLSACAPQAAGGTAPASVSPETTASEAIVADGKGYHRITAEQAKAMIDARGVTVVDVRTPSEYATSHIPGAILLPNEEIGEVMPLSLPDRDAVLLIYCRTGARSWQAGEKLAALGYTNVYDFGGIADWLYGTVEGGPAECNPRNEPPQ